MRWALPLVTACLLAASITATAVSRDDTAIIFDATVMELHAVQSYKGAEAGTERALADLDSDGIVNASEVAAYEASAAASRVGGPTAAIRWDSTATTWVDLNATTLNLGPGNVGNTPWSVHLEGTVALTSLPADEHTMTIAPPTTFSAYALNLTVPSNWSIANVTGMAISWQDSRHLSGSVTPGALAVVSIRVAPPPGEPPLNDTVAPVVSAGGDRGVVAGTLVVLDANVSDNDPDIASTGRFWWVFTYNGSRLNLSGQHASFTFWDLGDHAINFSAMDRAGNVGSASFVLAVSSPDLVAPTCSVGPDRVALAGSPVWLNASVADNDPSVNTTGKFWWTFAHNGTDVNLSGMHAQFTFWVPGLYNLNFTAVDGWGNRAESRLNLTIESPDTRPPTVDAGSDEVIVVGGTVVLNGSASDAESEIAGNGLWWEFNYGGSTITRDYNQSFLFDQPGTYVLTLKARDVWGNVGSDTRTVEVKANATAPAGAVSPPGLEIWLAVALLGVAGAAAAGVVAFRRGAAAGASAQPAVAAAPPPRGPSYVVEGLLILYRDGRLIHHEASAPSAQFESPEVIASMFTAVTEFIRDSFKEEGALSRLSYGQNTILLERSPHLFGAAIVYGEPDAALQAALRESLSRLESAYAGVVERWNGERSLFSGMEPFLAPLFASTATVTREAVRAATRDNTVKIVSGTEHYRGYVRLRVALVNQTDTKLSDALLTVAFNEKVLRLARIEPPGLERQGLTVRLGEVQPGERVGAIYFLDPQSCSQTNIEGIARYRDASGEERTVAMKPRLAEIVCPLFFTPDHANPATMKRLVETSLHARDSKLFRVRSLPEGAEYGALFAIAREAVQRHHVVLVRNIVKKPPFDGRAWFYGQTKNSKSSVIIRATVSEQLRMVELFVAVDSPGTLTGLLADFNRSFWDLMAARLPKAELEQVMDDALKGLMAPDEFDEGASPAQP